MQIGDEFKLNIAVLSGKGGTGKTTVSTNLAIALNANYIDCDVEEPNGFLFLKPEISKKEDVMADYPIIDDDKCISCNACINICEFNALARVKDDIILFQKLCHGCGACKIACRYNAVDYSKRQIGRIERGNARGIKCERGILNVSEPMAVPIIRALLKNLPQGVNLMDCPPGTSCNVVNALNYADAAILVTEPSEFGLHDLKMAVELVKICGIPFGIIINKDNGENNIIRQYCKQEKIKIIGSIPYSRHTAVLYSMGKMLYDDLNHKAVFDGIAQEVREVLFWN